LFSFEETAAESYRLLGEAYNEHAPSQKTWFERWFQRFKIGDFDVADKEHGKSPKKYEDVELQALLDKHDSQTQKQFAEQLSIVNKLFLIAYERWERLRKSADELNERQMERRKNTCEILLERYRRKSFLHRNVTGDEKWIFFENPKRKKSWIDPGAPSTSTARSNRFGRETMLCV